MKGPNTPFVVRQGKHWTFGAKINAAVNQANDYEDFLEEESDRIYFVLRSGIKAYNHSILMVGARHNDVIDRVNCVGLRCSYT